MGTVISVPSPRGEETAGLEVLRGAAHPFRAAERGQWKAWGLGGLRCIRDPVFPVPQGLRKSVLVCVGSCWDFHSIWNMGKEDVKAH